MFLSHQRGVITLDKQSIKMKRTFNLEAGDVYMSLCSTANKLCEHR